MKKITLIITFLVLLISSWLYFYKNSFFKEDSNFFENKKEYLKVEIPTANLNEQGEISVNFKTYLALKDKDELNTVLKKLFKIKTTKQEKTWNGLTLDSAYIKEGSTAIINLKGNWFPAGDFSGSYFKNEINEAVFKLENIEKIKVLINGKIFNWCIDSAEDKCDKTSKFWIAKRK
jgi:uncharacterized protein YxeA